jgi:hypothetical protein
MGCSSILLSSLWSVGEKEQKARGGKEKIPVLLYIDTREGQSRLILLKTEAAGDSRSTNGRGPSFVGSLDSFCR